MLSKINILSAVIALLFVAQASASPSPQSNRIPCVDGMVSPKSPRTPGFLSFILTFLHSFLSAPQHLNHAADQSMVRFVSRSPLGRHAEIYSVMHSDVMAKREPSCKSQDIWGLYTLCQIHFDYQKDGSCWT